MRCRAVGAALALTVAVAGPQVSVDQAEVEPGDRMAVTVTGWPGGNVLVELCGNEAARGAADCAVASSVQTYVGEDGTAVVLLPVTAPPVACPCVVRARDPAGTVTATGPITVDGVTAGAAADPAEPGEVVVTGLDLSGGWSWAALFGGPAPRTLTVTLQHTGDASLVDPPVTLLVGRGEHPTTLVPVPGLGPIGPGQRATYRMPVTLPAPAFGHYTLRGEVAGAAFLAETTTYPWGLTGLLAVLIAGAAIPVVGRRRPLGRSRAPAPASPAASRR